MPTRQCNSILSCLHHHSKVGQLESPVINVQTVQIVLQDALCDLPLGVSGGLINLHQHIKGVHQNMTAAHTRVGCRHINDTITRTSEICTKEQALVHFGAYPRTSPAKPHETLPNGFDYNPNFSLYFCGSAIYSLYFSRRQLPQGRNPAARAVFSSAKNTRNFS